MTRSPGPSRVDLVDDRESQACPWCGSEALDLGPGSGPHPASVVCKDCGRHVRWVGLPIDRDGAAAFVMPFGRHAGTPMGELPRGYLEWIASTIKGRIAERARALLEHQPCP